MYKALNYWVFGGFDGQKTPYEFIDWAAEKKLDGVELTIGDCLKNDITEDESRKIAAYAKSRNIGLRSLATGSGWNCALTSDDPAERANAVENVKKYLQIAAWIGAEAVLVVPGATRVAWDPSRPVVSYKNAWENATAAIREIVPVAEKLKVSLAVENVWNRFLISPMEWKFFLDQFKSGYVGIYFDRRISPKSSAATSRRFTSKTLRKRTVPAVCTASAMTCSKAWSISKLFLRLSTKSVTKDRSQWK